MKAHNETDHDCYPPRSKVPGDRWQCPDCGEHWQVFPTGPEPHWVCVELT
jgi:hypothetical protein